MSPTIHDANHFGPLTEERRAPFEAELGAALPADYRAFLLAHNGGRPVPAHFTAGPGEDGDTQESSVEWFLALPETVGEEDGEGEPGAGNDPDEIPPYFAQPIPDVLAMLREENSAE